MASRTASISIYKQIIEYFQLEIASGRLKNGAKIDSIRSLALFFKANPNTVQKALNELEQEGLIETDRTNGKYITCNEQDIRKLRQLLTESLSEILVKRAQTMGMDQEETVAIVKKIWEKEHA